MYEKLVLVEFNNTEPFVEKHISEEEITMDRIVKNIESREEKVCWDRDSITILENIETVNLDG